MYAIRDEYTKDLREILKELKEGTVNNATAILLILEATKNAIDDVESDVIRVSNGDLNLGYLMAKTDIRRMMISW